MEETKFENGIVEENEVYDEVPEESGNGAVVAVVIGLGIAVAAGVGALVYKSRDKIEARRIAKLEKKGYTVIGPTNVIDEDSDDEANQK